MVRTAGTAIKTTGGKSTKSIAAGGGGTAIGVGGGSRKTVGGNKLVQRPIPKWQRPIGRFFKRPVDMETDITKLTGLSGQTSDYRSDMAALITDMVDTGLSDTSSTAVNASLTSLDIEEDEDCPELSSDVLDDIPEVELESRDKENDIPEVELESRDKENKAPIEALVEEACHEASTSSKPDNLRALIKRKFPTDDTMSKSETKKRLKTIPDFILLEQFENENCKIATNIVL